jgi:hypothetical protein
MIPFSVSCLHILSNHSKVEGTSNITAKVPEARNLKTQKQLKYYENSE